MLIKKKSLDNESSQTMCQHDFFFKQNKSSSWHIIKIILYIFSSHQLFYTQMSCCSESYPYVYTVGSALISLTRCLNTHRKVGSLEWHCNSRHVTTQSYSNTHYSNTHDSGLKAKPQLALLHWAFDSPA